MSLEPPRGGAYSRAISASTASASSIGLHALGERLRLVHRLHPLGEGEAGRLAGLRPGFEEHVEDAGAGAADMAVLQRKLALRLGRGGAFHQDEPEGGPEACPIRAGLAVQQHRRLELREHLHGLTQHRLGWGHPRLKDHAGEGEAVAGTRLALQRVAAEAVRPQRHDRLDTGAGGRRDIDGARLGGAPQAVRHPVAIAVDEAQDAVVGEQEVLPRLAPVLRRHQRAAPPLGACAAAAFASADSAARHLAQGGEIDHPAELARRISGLRAGIVTASRLADPFDMVMEGAARTLHDKGRRAMRAWRAKINPPLVRSAAARQPDRRAGPVDVSRRRPHRPAGADRWRHRAHRRRRSGSTVSPPSRA